RFGDLGDVVDQVGPLAGGEQAGDLGGEPLVPSVQRRVCDLDAVGVVGQPHRVALALVAHQRDDLVGPEGALEGEQAADRDVRDRARVLVALDRDVVDLREVDRSSGRAGGVHADGGGQAVPALEPGDGRV